MSSVLSEMSLLTLQEKADTIRSRIKTYGLDPDSVGYAIVARRLEEIDIAIANKLKEQRK